MNISPAIPVAGIDVTSAPSPRKPITVAQGSWDGSGLQIDRIELLDSIGSLATFIGEIDPEVPSITGFDCPLGQPRRLVDNLGWVSNWETTVSRFASMSRAEFVAFLRSYREPRQAGDKQHLRRTDAETGGCSPMMVHGVPVGLMYHSLVPLLAESPLSLLPCRPTRSPAIVVEVYPALLARRAAPRQTYKMEKAHGENESRRRAARQAILESLVEREDRSPLGFSTHLPRGRLGALGDSKGDRLDAILAAASAAWAWTQRRHGWGFSKHFDAFEGAIVDPTRSTA